MEISSSFMDSNSLATNSNLMKNNSSFADLKTTSVELGYKSASRSHGGSLGQKSLSDLDLEQKQLSDLKLSLKKLTDEKLDQSLYAYVKKEKEVLMEILCHIAEIDRRRLYLTFGYSSLYVYLTERMGYEDGSAQRRLDAARLSHFVPTVISNLAQGELTISKVTFLQKSLRQNKEQKITAEEKATIFEAIKHKTLEESQIHVAKALRSQSKNPPK